MFSSLKTVRIPTIAIGLIIVLLGVAILLSLTRSDRILDKYSGHKDFPTVVGALRENLAFIKANPKNDGEYYSLGQGLFTLQGYDDAIWAFNEAIKISPNVDYYWSFLGKAYQAKRDYKNAVNAYKKALDLKPDKPLYYTTLAWVYYFRIESEREEAFRILKEGTEKFPSDHNILFDLTRYYMYDENKEEFLRYAPRYMKLDPNYKPINDVFNKWRK